MCHHLRFAGSAGSKIHQRDVVVSVRMAWTYKWSGIFDALMEIFETFRYFRSDTDQLFYSGTLGESIFDMLQDDSFTGSYDHFDIGSVAAIDNIFFGQQVGGRNDGCSQFVKGDGAIPELITAFQNQHHHVPTTDTQTLEVRSGHICVTLHFGK